MCVCVCTYIIVYMCIRAGINVSMCDVSCIVHVVARDTMYVYVHLFINNYY